MNIDFWFGISLGMLITSGFFWAIKPEKSEVDGQEEDVILNKLNKLELKNIDSENKIAHLEGRIYGLTEYLREKLK